MRRTLRPSLRRPHDFGRFWARTQAELESVDPSPSRTKELQTKDSSLLLENISFDSLSGARVHGYLLHAGMEQGRPLIVHSHGYNSQCDVQWRWAQAGVDVVGIDVRGFGRSAQAVPEPSRHGYVLTGWRTPESSVLRGAVCDYIRAVEVGRRLLAAPPTRTVLHGTSFAGGLALMAEALLQTADLLALASPTFGWTEGRHFFVKSGSGEEINRFLHARPEVAEDLMLVLRYFDPIHFAERVVCPSLVGVGLQDEVVPAKTVYAIANHLGGPHEIREFPVGHTNLPEEQLWEAFEAEWLSMATKGVPSGFGVDQSIGDHVADHGDQRRP